MLEAFRSKDEPAQRELLNLLGEITDSAGLRSHVWCSNPQIEAAVRASEKRAFLFVINHESTNAAARIRLADLPFEIASIKDVDSAREVAFKRDGAFIEIEVEARLGAARLLEVTPEHPAPRFVQMR